MDTAHFSQHAAYFELLHQLAQPGCAICLLAARAAARHMETLCGESLLDPPTRIQLRASLGFCAQHAHALDETAPRLTVAILYEDFLRRAEEQLDGWARARRSPEIPGPCSACRAAREQETESLRLLATAIDDAEMSSAYDRSDGLCLRHTLHLCRSLKEPARRRVVAVERERIGRLRAELAEVIRKHDYRFRDEPWGEERSAPGRAVDRVVGTRATPDP